MKPQTPKGDPQDNSQLQNPKNQNDSRPNDSEPRSKHAVSDRKRRANRENAKKSTGPKTMSGKRRSRFNAVKHGLLACKLMFDAAGQPKEEALHELLQSLHDQYGRGDVRVELLLETMIVEYWRLSQGLRHEVKFLQDERHFGAQGGIPNLQRYQTASKRALLRDMEVLEKLQAKSSQAQQAVNAEDEEQAVSPDDQGSSDTSDSKEAA